MDKAKRAWFSIENFLKKSSQKNVNTYIKIFDMVIKPIALYSCEIWGKCMKIENNVATFGNSTWERFHTRICKNILGVHRRASNLASVAELGRYPITIEIKKRMVRYFLRFRGMNKNRLVYKAFEEQLKDETNPNNWVKKVEEILNGSGFSFIFNEATELNNETAIKGIKQA